MNRKTRVCGRVGQWEVENHGVSPDIETEFDLKAWREGRDAQLEKAVRLAAAGTEEETSEETSASAVSNYHNRRLPSSK
ncbi:MAG: hypothetical protein L0312_21665 [Acidobacteria bacterium]|nr:hypothetical protein [Acidobacteriota bacterium]